MEISFSEAKGMFSTVVDLIKKGSQMEAQAQIQKLQEQYLGLHAENLELKQELLELKSKYTQQKNMVFDEPFFYEVVGDNKEGPYCPKCWQKDERKCRVVKTPDSYHSAQKCQVCNELFGKGKPVPTPRVLR